MLQLALDTVLPEEIPGVISAVTGSVDIIEIGTPFISRFGMAAIIPIRERFPEAVLLADIKIMDGGRLETRYAAEYGANYITVLAAAEDITIRNAVEEAASRGLKTMADMIGVRDVRHRAAEVDELGVDYICAHTAVDAQRTGCSPFEDYNGIRSAVRRAGIAIAGGVSLANLDGMARAPADIVVVGGGIMHSADIGAAARAFREKLDNMAKGREHG